MAPTHAYPAPRSPSSVPGYLLSEIRVSWIQIAASSQRPREARSSQSVVGVQERYEERPKWTVLGSGLRVTVGPGEPWVRGQPPTLSADPRRKTMRPPGALGSAPAAPPASPPDPPPARLQVATANPALGGRRDTAFSSPLRQSYGSGRDARSLVHLERQAGRASRSPARDGESHRQSLRPGQGRRHTQTHRPS